MNPRPGGYWFQGGMRSGPGAWWDPQGDHSQGLRFPLPWVSASVFPLLQKAHLNRIQNGAPTTAELASAPKTSVVLMWKASLPNYVYIRLNLGKFWIKSTLFNSRSEAHYRALRGFLPTESSLACLGSASHGHCYVSLGPHRGPCRWTT